MLALEDNLTTIKNIILNILEHYTYMKGYYYGKTYFQYSKNFIILLINKYIKGVVLKE